MNKRKIIIQAREYTYYYQEVEVTEEQFNILNSIEDDEVNKTRETDAYHLLESLIDRSDLFYTGEDFENINISEIK